MKFITTVFYQLFFLLLISLAVSAIEAGKPDLKCDVNSGCIILKKFLIWTPLRDPGEQPLLKQEEFDTKYLAVYKDKINIYFEKKVGNDAVSLARRLSFSDIRLQCNQNDKICTIREYQELYNNFKIIDQIQTKMGDLVAKKCLILPIIDSSNREPQETMVYICESDLNRLRDLYQLRDALSRLIQSYQFMTYQDIYNSANSVCKKEGLVKTVDSNNQLNTVMLRTFSSSLQVYKDPQALNSLVYEIPVTEINHKQMAQTVTDAIKLGYIDNQWSQNMQPKPIAQCCFYLPLNSALKQLFYCIHYDNPLEFDYNDCSTKAKAWVREINTVVSHNHMMQNLIKIRGMEQSQVDCEQVKEVKVFVRKLESIAQYQDRMCNDLSQFLPSWNPNNCKDDKESDILQMIDALSLDNSKLRQSLQLCIKKGAVNLGKQWDAKSKSFIQLSQKVTRRVQHHPTSFLQTQDKNGAKQTDVFQEELINGQKMFTVKLGEQNEEAQPTDASTAQQKLSNDNTQQENDQPQFYSPTQQGADYDNFYLDLKEGDYNSQSYETIAKKRQSFIEISRKHSLRGKSKNVTEQPEVDANQQPEDQTNIPNAQNTTNTTNTTNKTNGNVFDPQLSKQIFLKKERLKHKLLSRGKDPVTELKKKIKFDQDFNAKDTKRKSEVFVNYLNSISQNSKKLNQHVKDHDIEQLQQLSLYKRRRHRH